MRVKKLFTFIFFGYYEKVSVKNCTGESHAWTKLKKAFDVEEITIWKIDKVCQ